MNMSARDDGQLGLWSMPVTEKSATTTARPRPSARREPSARRGSAPPVPASDLMDERKLWGIDDVADYLGVPVQTVYGWRHKSYGPPAIKVGKHLRWHPATVIAWAKQQERPRG